AFFDNTPPFGFSLSPVSGQVLAGKSVSTNFTVSTGTAGQVTVDLLVSGLPTGASAQLNVTSGLTDYGVSLNITTATATPRGIYSVRITGSCPDCANGAGFSAFTIFVLTVDIRDIAVMSVAPSATSADIGLPVSVSLVVKNKGTTLETFAVNLWANNTLVASMSTVALSPGTSQTLTLVWDTTAFSPGIYNITGKIPPLLNEFNIVDNSMSGGTVRLVFADAAITGVTPSPVVVNPSQTVTITITVANNGLSPEDFTVSVFVVSSGGEKSSLASLQVTLLAPGQATTLVT